MKATETFSLQLFADAGHEHAELQSRGFILSETHANNSKVRRNYRCSGRASV